MKKKILIVDDDSELIEAVMNILKNVDYDCAAASDGKQGLEMMKKEKPDVVLLDVMMAHDTEGFDVARAAKQDPDIKNIPIILLTGIRKAKGMPFKYEPDEDWLPVAAVLEKPVKPNVLIKAIQDALA